MYNSLIGCKTVATVRGGGLNPFFDALSLYTISHAIYNNLG